MSYKIEETLTEADYSAFIAAYTLHAGHGMIGGVLKGNALILRVLGVLLMVFGGLLAVLPLLSGRINLLTLIGAACIWGGLVWFRKYKSAGAFISSEYEYRLKKQNISDILVHISFENDTFFVLENGKSSSYHYSAVSGLWEDSKRYYLFLQGKMHCIIRKDSFVEGEPEQFSTFMCEKTEKPAEFIEVN